MNGTDKRSRLDCSPLTPINLYQTDIPEIFRTAPNKFYYDQLKQHVLFRLYKGKPLVVLCSSIDSKHNIALELRCELTIPCKIIRVQSDLLPPRTPCSATPPPPHCVLTLPFSKAPSGKVPYYLKHYYYRPCSWNLFSFEPGRLAFSVIVWVEICWYFKRRLCFLLEWMKTQVCLNKVSTKGRKTISITL